MGSSLQDKAAHAYDLLAKIAAETYYPINYAVLGALIEHPAHFMGHVLDLVAQRCQSQGEPDLTSFVVLGETKEPGKGYRGPLPAKDERRKCYVFHWERKHGRPFETSP